MPSIAIAWDDCPFGLVNDRYPGRCGLYEDANHDSICDHSQHRLLQAAAVADSAVARRTALAPVRPKPAQKTPITPVGAAAPRMPSPTTAATDPRPKAPSPLRQRYPLWQIVLATAVLAALTELATARNRKLALPLQAAWNWALGLSFLATVFFCVPFVYPALLKAVNFNLAYWHSLTGLAMTAIGLYHLVRRAGPMWRGARSWFSGGSRSKRPD
ncbi:MAG TPA: hypothetical protein VMF29_09550 [Candidatus Edwardsbacteria bacterium]|nr:hypothetical protein [Candidatus Edwardsbacteria bacterium]